MHTARIDFVAFDETLWCDDFRKALGSDEGSLEVNEGGIYIKTYLHAGHISQQNVDGRCWFYKVYFFILNWTVQHFFVYINVRVIVNIEP